MLKKFYILVWLLAVGAVLAAVLTGTFSEAAMVVFSFIGLGLIYALALWAVIANPREMPTR